MRCTRVSLRIGQDLRVDSIDRAIIARLVENARLPNVELAARVNLSPSPCMRRVRALEEAGVIRGYLLDVDPAAVGLPVGVWVRVRPSPGCLPKIEQLAREIGEVSECHRVSGEDCFLLRVHVPTIADLEDLLDRFLVHGSTTSSFVVATPVPPRTPRPGAPE